MRLALLLLAVLLIGSVAWLYVRPGLVGMPRRAALAASTFAPATDPQFAPGQVWAYRTRAQDTASTLTILRVEQASQLGTVVHIAVEGLQVRNPNAPGGVLTRAAHLPFAREAVLQSVTEQRGAVTVPPHEEGYQQWRQAVAAERGGIFTIPVAEAVALLEPRG